MALWTNKIYKYFDTFLSCVCKEICQRIMTSDKNITKINVKCTINFDSYFITAKLQV